MSSRPQARRARCRAKAHQRRSGVITPSGRSAPGGWAAPASAQRRRSGLAHHRPAAATAALVRWDPSAYPVEHRSRPAPPQPDACRAALRQLCSATPSPSMAVAVVGGRGPAAPAGAGHPCCCTRHRPALLRSPLFVSTTTSLVPRGSARMFDQLDASPPTSSFPSGHTAGRRRRSPSDLGRSSSGGTCDPRCCVRVLVWLDRRGR